MNKLSNLTNGVAVANQSGAMEQRNHFKNGDSPKIHRSRANFFSYFIAIAFAVSTAFSSCGGGGNKMIMKAETDRMSFKMVGFGNATIDWGDGVCETHEIGNDSWFSHKYTGISVRTVTINGKNITELHCGDNRLTSLDISKNTALECLLCHYNQLTNLDLSKNSSLRELHCDNNQLTSLNVSKNNTAFNYMYCNNNKLTDSALDAFFRALPKNTGKNFLIINDNPGVESCDKSIATNKGWSFSRE